MTHAITPTVEHFTVVQSETSYMLKMKNVTINIIISFYNLIITKQLFSILESLESVCYKILWYDHKPLSSYHLISTILI